jgi:hypothetical protein
MVALTHWKFGKICAISHAGPVAKAVMLSYDAISVFMACL